MASTDERVVELKFYNQQFENGVRTSIESLKNLKGGLNLDESTKSLSNLDRVGKTFSLAGIAEGVNTIASRFSTLGIIGVTALQNITNSALNAGKSIISALTIDPIKSGLEEYETKMNAITTIMTNTASKGTTLDDVNKSLNELNLYADQTIYNFAEMTRNIGTFTAAGVDLKTSTTSIKGIANLAAGSGSTALQASTAMYQLSQAIAAGSVKLQDWNSVVNAGMGGELFQKALEKTAKELGHGRDMSVSFRDSLQDGWITTAVLTKTLAKFAEDKALLQAATQVKTFTQLLDTMKESVQSGWAQSWENIIGNKDEAAAFFTSVNNGFGSIIGSSSNARNEMLAFWKANGGREAIIQALTNSFKGLQSILSPIGLAFREIFPAMTGQRLVELSKAVKDLTDNFKMGEETSIDIEYTFKGLFAVLDIGKQALFALGRGLSSMIGYLAPSGHGILAFTANIGEMLISLDNAVKKGDVFNKAIDKIGNFMKPVADGIGTAITAIINAFKSLGMVDLSGLDTFSNHVSAKFEPLTKLGGFVGTMLSGIVGIIKKMVPIVYGIATVIGNAFDKIRANITNAFSNTNMGSIFSVINGGLFITILFGLKKFVTSLTEITDSAGGFLSSITGILDGVKGSLQAYQSSLKAESLMRIAIAIGILALSLLTIASIDPAKLTISLAAMTTMFIELFAAMAVFEKISGGLGFLAMGKITTAMIGLSIAILILSHALTVISKIDQEGIQKGLTAIAVLAGILIGSSKLLSTSSGNLIRSSLGFILFGVAISILVSSIKRLSEINVDALSKSLLGIGALMLELSLFMKLTGSSKMSMTSSIGILVLAGALIVLSIAVKKFSEIDKNALIKGLGGVAIVLAEVAVFVNLTGNAKNVITTAIGLTILGSAMLVFAIAVEKMGSLSMEQIGKGLLTMAGALTIITLALSYMPKGIVLQSVGLVVIAGALLMLSNVLTSMGGMSWEAIAKGLTALAGALTVIAVAMNFMTTALPGATALLIIAGALAILTPCLIALGGMSLTEIGKGLLALAGIFTVLGVAGLVLAPLTPVILALSVAIALFGVGCIAVGIGMLAFSAGLAALAVSGTAGALALVAIVTALVSLIPFIAKTLAQGLIDFIKVIGDGTPLIAEAVVKVVKAIVTALGEVIPTIVTALMQLLDTILKTLLDYVPNIIESGMKLILGFLKGIKDHIKEVVEQGVDVLLQFIEGVISKLPAIVDTALRVIITFINGLADAIRNNHDALYSAVANLVTAIVEAIIDLMPKIIEVGSNIIRGLIKGFENMAWTLVRAVTGVVGDAVQGIRDFLGIESPSKVFAEIGKYSGEGLVIGLTNMSGKVSSASKDLANVAVSSLSGAMSKVSDSLSGDVEIQPTIRPVIDLTDVNKGLSSTFDKSQTINVDEIRSKTATISNMDSVRRTSATDTVAQTLVKETPDTNNTGLTLRIANFVNNRTQDIQALVEEMEFYRKQVAVGRGGN